MKGSDVDKCYQIDVVIKVVQKMVYSNSCANVDVNVESSVECIAKNSCANVDVNVESTSINEMPSSSFVNASTSKRWK